MTFPVELGNDDVFSQVNSALMQIDQRMGPVTSNLTTWVFHAVFIEGLSLKETVDCHNSRPFVRSAERVRQIANELREKLLQGQRIKALRHARLRNSLAEELRALRAESTIDQEVCGCVTKVLPGVAFLLGYRILSHDSRLPMLAHPLILSESISSGVFVSHFLAVFSCLQEEVRPLSLSILITRVSQHANLCDMEIDRDTIRFVLSLRRYITLKRKTDGEALYSLRFEYLKIYQKAARIIYERKSVSYRQILEGIKLREGKMEYPSTTAMRKRYPWCVPIGKMLWIYSPEGYSILSAQSFVREYCGEKVRFTYEELKNTMKSRGYEIKDKSLRSYILCHCRSMNTDGTRFCLKSAITEEEEKFYRRKSVLLTGDSLRIFHEELFDKIEQILLQAPLHTLPLVTVRKECDEYLREKNIQEARFYKIVDSFGKTERIKKIRLQKTVLLQLDT